MTTAQAQTLVGGYYPSSKDHLCTYIINVTRFKRSNPKRQSENTGGQNFSNQKVNTIDNSRKIYINGVPIKGERNIAIIC
jgi:hypothetical protein